MRTRRRGQEGFTLVELLLSVSILLIILSAISAALIVFLQNGTYATQRDDHSGGAAVMSTYLNRDLASADTASQPGSTCSGSGTNVLTLQWTQWSATVAAPSPAPGGGLWRSSYVVRPDATTTGRYQLVRVHCPATGATDTTVLVQGLLGTSTANAASLLDVDIQPGTTTCAGGPVRFTLPAYATDSTDPYTYSGCLEGRIR